MQPVANTTSVATGMDDPADSFHEYDNKIAQIARSGYPEMARLRQVTGVGELIALTYVLTLEDPQRFRRNRAAVADHQGRRCVFTYAVVPPLPRHTGVNVRHAPQPVPPGRPATG